MSKSITRILIVVCGWCTAQMSEASDVTGLTTFVAQTTAKAAEVNGNFTAVKTAVDDNNARIAALVQTVASLQASLDTANAIIATLQTTVSNHASQINAFNNSNVMALDPYLQLTNGTLPKVMFKGINVQVVNGQNATRTSNGLGNLIVGYDEADSTLTARCTLGTNPSTGALVTDATTCAAAGGTWSTAGFKTGSHYLVVGAENNYSRYGGLIVGFQNTSNYDFASVSGGWNNVASGSVSSVTGGRYNTASGLYSSVVGGYGNTASGLGASVSGGMANVASGNEASVSGGRNGSASNSLASVSGGYMNTASGDSASVSGGSYNKASGLAAHISGGGGTSSTVGNVAGYPYSSILGGVSQSTSSVSQTIPALP